MVTPKYYFIWFIRLLLIQGQLWFGKVMISWYFKHNPSARFLQFFVFSNFPFFSLLPDVDVPSPDEKSVITYVSSIYDAFPKIPEGGEGIAAHVCHCATIYTLAHYRCMML